MVDLVQHLESNDPKLVDDAKQLLHERFNTVREPWLVSGLYESYLQSNSTRLIDVLANVREPHYMFLFDKISESIKGSKDNIKYQGLTLLGHIVRNQPTWIYKITTHPLMKELLKLLKTEPNILLLLSALMPLIVLIPLVPSLIGVNLQEIFDIYCRLAGLNFNESAKFIEEQKVHLQVALYALFLRLYGMYPCNFLSYLRIHYRNKSLSPVFAHTIKPMLHTVRMNPYLVSTATESETSKERWVKMSAHDVIIECEKFSLDFPDTCSHDGCLMSTFRSRSGTTNSVIHSESPNQLHALRNVQSNAIMCENFFSPCVKLDCATPPVTEVSMTTPIPFTQNIQTTAITSVSHISQESSSPPEAAIEATPETTPIRVQDSRLNRFQPQNPSTIRSHTFGSKISTPGNSQPSSPMRKDASSFNFDRQNSAFGYPKKDQLAGKLHKLVQDRQNIVTDSLELRRLPPTSPVKIPSDNNFSTIQRLESPFSQEDEEVSQIVRDGDSSNCTGRSSGQCDSVVHELEGVRGDEDDQEHGSPCSAGGLHLPNIKSFIDFTSRIKRLRKSSQGTDDAEKNEFSTGSSPGNAVSYPNNQVRRANSCPDIKKSPTVPTRDNINKTLLETDEDASGEAQEAEKPVTNGLDTSDLKQSFLQKKLEMLRTSETQTENFWPMPYEHLFLSIFPSLESNEAKCSTGALFTKYERVSSGNSYDITERYYNLCGNGYESADFLKNQIELLKLQLHFEKHRREMHAFKNRSLWADARNTRALEEHNAALRDQVQIKQKDIDNLVEELHCLKFDRQNKDVDAKDSIELWEVKFNTLQIEYMKLLERHEDQQKLLDTMKEHLTAIDGKWQKAESELTEARKEVENAREQAEAGERGRMELDHLNREFVLFGELHKKYQERLNDLAMLRRSDVELMKLTETAKHEVQTLTNQLEIKRNQVDAYRCRISELELMIQKHDDASAAHKKQLNEVKEECRTKIDAMDDKHMSQDAANRLLEDKLLELRSRLELCTKKVISPDTSSCNEVNVSEADKPSTAQAASAQTSPLSASLSLSEGNVSGPSDPTVRNVHAVSPQMSSPQTSPLVMALRLSPEIILAGPTIATLKDLHKVAELMDEHNEDKK